MAVVVSEAFDDLQSRHLRIVDEAAKLGPVTFLLWSDEVITQRLGRAPKFPIEERRYFWGNCKFVSKLVDADDVAAAGKFDQWVMEPGADTPERRAWSEKNGVKCVTLSDAVLKKFPDPPACPNNPKSNRKKIIVTGCFDLFHTGHVRFFEEVSELGDLYVCVGHDANIRLLKGEGRPLFPQSERCFTTGSMKFVTQSLVTSGDGWLDAEPEIERLKPDAYAVNEDGDKPDKQEYCAKHGIEYIVLKREPKPGLTRRSSTDLRGF